MKGLFFILLIILTQSCGNKENEPEFMDSSNADSSFLSSKEWKLKGYETGDVRKSVTLEFKTLKNQKGENILSGKCSVNFYEAAYTIGENNTIQILSLYSTEIGGTKEDMEFENDFFTRINNVEKYEFSNNQLVLSDGKKTLIYFN